MDKAVVVGSTLCWDGGVGWRFGKEVCLYCVIDVSHYGDLPDDVLVCEEMSCGFLHECLVWPDLEIAIMG